MRIQEACNMLGLTAPFTAAQAKEAYRVKALKLHPDKGGSSALMKLLNEAYIVCKGGVMFKTGPVIDLSGVVIKRRKLNVTRWFCNKLSHKKRKETAKELLKEIKRMELDSRDKQVIIERCVDVANLAMEIANKARNLL